MIEIAVAGPGLMGLGIAQIAAAAGCRVHLIGRDAGAALRGRDRLAQQLEREVTRGRLEAGAVNALLQRVVPADDDRTLAHCVLAIEAVPEARAVKEAVLQRLQSALPASAWIATNTSGLPISGLARALRDPSRLVGLHFFSPVPRMKLVEVVRGDATPEATLRSALGFVERLGQVPIVVRDAPGFFTSRVFAAYLDEALAMLAEGVDPTLIEQVAVDEVGRAIGPLAVLDDISLELNWQQIRQARADGLPPERCRPDGAPVLEAMVARGRGGRRQGGGFYDNAVDGRRRPWPALAELFPLRPVQPAASEVALRLRCAEAMEALRCLEHGVISSADDADTGSLLGLGYQPSSGGVLSWVEKRGLADTVSTCEALARAHGERFRPSAWLRALCDGSHGLRRYRAAPLDNPEGAGS